MTGSRTSIPCSARSIPARATWPHTWTNGQLKRSVSSPFARGRSTSVGSPDKDVRRAVAFNRAAPAAMLAFLAEDPYPLNRVILAGHPNLGLAHVERLLDDPEPQVRFAAAAHLARLSTPPHAAAGGSKSARD